jgi:hypothetical protein
VLAKSKVYPGDSVPKLDLERDFPWLDHKSQQARDIERFRSGLPLARSQVTAGSGHRAVSLVLQWVRGIGAGPPEPYY